MHRFLPKSLSCVFLFVQVWFGTFQTLHGQVTVDSMKKLVTQASANANQAKYNEALMQAQSMFYSDTLMAMQKNVIASARQRVGENHPAYAGSLVGMAILYVFRGAYEKSLPLFQQAITIFKNAKQEENIQYTIAIKNLGLLYERIGQYDKALSYYQQSLVIRKRILKETDPTYPLLYPLNLADIANLYMTMGQREKALPLFEEALEIRRKFLGESHPYYSISMNNLARYYSITGNYDKARPLFERALDTLAKKYSENDVDYLFALNNLASLYVKMGELDKAGSLFERILTIRRKELGDDHPDYAKSLINSGLVKLHSGNQSDLSHLFIEADNITLKHLNRTYSTLSEFEKWAFLSQESNQFYYLPSLFLNKRLVEPEIVSQIYKNELALKGMVLEDQRQVLRSIRQSNDSISLNLYKQWYLNKTLLGKHLLMPKAQQASFQDSLEEKTIQLEEQLSRRSAAFNNLQTIQSVNGKEISAKLSKDEAAIEFIRFSFYNKDWTDSILYAALVILPGDSLPRFVPLCEEKELLRILSPSSNATSTVFKIYPARKLIKKSANPSDSIYRLIWKPLEKYMLGIHTINYAPTGLLHRISFNALRSDFDQLLIDKYQLNQVLSTRIVVKPVNALQKYPTAGIWGNIEYNLKTDTVVQIKTISITDTATSSFNLYTWDTRSERGGEWNGLPGTKKEIEKIDHIFQQAGIKATINTGTFASEENFKALDGKSPGIIHLATHGFFLPIKEVKTKNSWSSENNIFNVQQNPLLRSGLVLAGGNNTWKGEASMPDKEDGILTAYEIAQMDLSNTNLVVLSACETALGDLQVNEGVIGLQRAFKMAGVKQMLLSLWRVPDKETIELMTLFYENWTSGQSTNQALRSAQLVMRKKYSPFYWAAFVLAE